MAQQWDPSDLVGPAEIAERLGLRSAATVNQWVRRHRSFPTPIVRLRMGSVYSWREIERWWHERRPER